jgi:hypothetical protein
MAKTATVTFDSLSAHAVVAPVSCRNITRDPANVEDVLKSSGDDPADSARYGLKSRISPGRVPVEQRVAERVTAVDATSRAIWTQKFLADERAARKPAAIPHRWR